MACPPVVPRPWGSGLPLPQPPRPKPDRPGLQAQPIAGAGALTLGLDQIGRRQGAAQGLLQGAVDAGLALVEVFDAHPVLEGSLDARHFPGILAAELAVLGQEGRPQRLVAAPHPVPALALAAGHQAIEGQFHRGHLQPLAPGAQAAPRQVDDQRRRLQGALGGGHRLAKAGGASEQPLVEAVAQPDKGDFRQGDLGVAGVGQLVVAQGNDVVISRGVIKGGAALEGRRDQHMRQAVLGPAKETQGIAQVIAHGLAPPGDGDMQGGVGIGGEGAQGLGDGIRRPLVVRRGADVLQGRAVGVAQHLDMAGVEGHGRQLVVPAQAVKPARVRAQEPQPGRLGALGGGEQVDLGGDKGRLALHRQGIEGLGHHLGGQAGDGQQDAAGKAREPIAKLPVAIEPQVGEGQKRLLLPLSVFARSSSTLAAWRYPVFQP